MDKDKLDNLDNLRQMGIILVNERVYASPASKYMVEKMAHQCDDRLYWEILDPGPGDHKFFHEKHLKIVKLISPYENPEYWL